MHKIPRDFMSHLMRDSRFYTVYIKPPIIIGKFMGRDIYCDDFTQEYLSNKVKEAMDRLGELL